MQEQGRGERAADGTGTNRQPRPVLCLPWAAVSVLPSQQLWSGEAFARVQLRYQCQRLAKLLKWKGEAGHRETKCKYT